MRNTLGRRRAICLLFLILMILLAGCDSQNYRRAVGLQNEGQYADAAKLYESLGNYEDAPERLRQCRTMREAVDTLNKRNAELDVLTDAARKVIRSEEKALDETLREKLETTVTEASAAKFIVSEYPKTEAEVRAFVSIISDSDYSAEMTALRENTSALETSIKQYALVNAPSEAYVVKCLKKVKGVLGISAVTEDNDPNGKLNKAHCYIAAVYFSHKYVKQENVYGKTVIDKGTDGGGCVEVYSTEEDAIKRDEYLAAFDGTILVSGSHRVVGTVVVRTSNEMKASQQKKLEKAIIAELTRVG